MRSWESPGLPALPGAGRQLTLFDTHRGEKLPTTSGPLARMYVCGITPYDATHLGHAFTYVSFDMINRVWRDGGVDVQYVQNVTDIDDPLLERAVATGQRWQDIAERETALFRDDMAALRVLPPLHYIGAVEAIPAVVRYIQQLERNGDVYSVDGDLYFRVFRDDGFGGLSKLGPAEMVRTFADRGGDPDRAGKGEPLDCLVWQQERPGEPAWDSPLGHGRPGWHIECTAIALDFLGPVIDVQGGGRDLVFPHHEMGAAQAHRITGQPFARHFVHTGMVGWQGEKMSKSRGNLVFVSELRRAGIHPMDIRLALLDHHYRSDWEWSEADVSRARARRLQWMDAAHAEADELIERMRELLADDLKVPEALDLIDAYTGRRPPGRPRPSGGDDAGPRVADAVDTLLGVQLSD